MELVMIPANAPRWILERKRTHKIISPHCYCGPRSDSIRYNRILHHSVGGFTFQWHVAILASDDGFVRLVYRLISEPPPRTFDFYTCLIRASGYLNGTKWVINNKILGSELPVLEKEGRIYWNTIWWARRAESGLVGEPGVRSILDFLDPQTGNLEILFHLEFWRARSEIARLNPPMLVFDALRLANLPLELQTPPDVCLVTNGGIIKAHSMKLYHEFPGLLSDVGNAPLMSGYAWFEHNFDFTTVLKIVLVMYDVYYPGFNNDIITLLLFASRLKMRQLYVKLLRGQPNHQPQHQ